MEKLYGADSAVSAHDSMEISRIVDTMCGFQAKELGMAAFQELAPMADELVHYLAEQLDGKVSVPDGVTAHQVHQLVQFGIKF